MKYAWRGLSLVTIGLLAVVAAQAAEKGPDLRPGVLYGVVQDAESQKPIAGATVAAFDNKGRTIAWGKTDETGRYALVAPPLRALNLEKEGRGGGLLVTLVHGAGKVVKGAVGVTVVAARTVAGATIGQRSLGAAQSVASANAGNGPAGEVKQQVAQTAGQNVSAEVQGKLGLTPPPGAVGHNQHDQQKEALVAKPGQVIVKVVTANYQDFQGTPTVYWMEPPVKEEGKAEVGPQAWLEPVALAPAGKNGHSQVVQTRVLLQDGKLDPPMAAPGSKIKVSAAVSAPKQAGLDFRVFLVDDSADMVVELKAAEGGNYATEYTLPAKHPRGETVLIVAAIRTRPVTVNVSGAKEDVLPRLAARLDDLKPKTKYEYDPRILASYNRLELKLVVLDPKKGGADPSAIPVERKPAAPSGSAATPKESAPAAPEKPSTPPAADKQPGNHPNGKAP